MADEIIAMENVEIAGDSVTTGFFLYDITATIRQVNAQNIVPWPASALPTTVHGIDVGALVTQAWKDKLNAGTAGFESVAIQNPDNLTGAAFLALAQAEYAKFKERFNWVYEARFRYFGGVFDSV